MDLHEYQIKFLFNEKLKSVTIKELESNPDIAYYRIISCFPPDTSPFPFEIAKHSRSEAYSVASSHTDIDPRLIQAIGLAIDEYEASIKIGSTDVNQI